jgi:hypothetical protein
MYLPAPYVVVMVLTVAIAVVMLRRHRSLPSYVAAAGAALQLAGLLLQVSMSPIPLPQGEAAVDLGSSWRLGNALMSAGSIVFLFGLLWYFLRARRVAAVEEAET